MSVQKIHEINLRKIIESIKLLSADYEVQSTILPEFVNITDELGLIFEDAMIYCDSIFKFGLINGEQYEMFQNLNLKLDQIECWNTDALKEGTEWKLIRECAKKTLQSLGDIQNKTPNLFWLDFIEDKTN
jgi:hypothetical protein